MQHGSLSLNCTVICLLWPVIIQGDPALYDHGDPDNDEQHMLEVINRARFDPEAEGQRYLDTTDTDVTYAIDYFAGNYALDIQAVAAEFATYPSRPPLALNASLMAVALNQSNYMIEIGKQTHKRPEDDPDPTVAPDPIIFRNSFTNEGYNPSSWIGENVFAYSKSVWYAHAAFNIDWGFLPGGIQDPPGHRISLMNYFPHDPRGTGRVVFTEIGVAIVPHTPEDDKDVGPEVVAQEFGFTLTDSFITGVVYDDDDGDGFYSPGEGIGGVTVMPDSGDYYAITTASGGYSIPIFNSQQRYEVSFSGAGISATSAEILTYTGDNYKLDLIDGSPTHYYFGHKDSRWRFERTVTGGSKDTEIGTVKDSNWPWMYHFNQQSWAYVPDPLPLQDGFHIYFPGDPGHWTWSDNGLYGWYYHYTDQTWYNFTSQ